MQYACINIVLIPLSKYGVHGKLISTKGITRIDNAYLQNKLCKMQNAQNLPPD